MRIILASAMLLTTAFFGTPASAKGSVERVNISSTGMQANRLSFSGVSGRSMTDDGRYVIFESEATNLVADDTNRASDVFVRDRATGKTFRVSVDAAEHQARGDSHGGVLSADGRFAVFDSNAPNLVANDTNGASDVFIRDLVSGQVTRVSIGAGGQQGDGGSSDGDLSADGKVVAFLSAARPRAG